MDIKTNAKCQDCVAAIKQAVKRKFPDADLKLVLETTDKVLHIHGLPEDSEHAAQVESAIKEAGFQGSWLTRGLENK
ncbi:MAG: hypothetical protein J1E16_08445 [Muribaculaceae bacterium]|nr:hypothetical protein [Muribaculaceae bacterium]